MTTSQPGETPLFRTAIRRLLAPAGLVGLVFFVLSDFLFGDGNTIPSGWRGDTRTYFLAARSFAAEQILLGNLPLWDPHSFAGNPFVGSFQSSVFYPLNALYLVLPFARAISIEFAFHLLLVGLFTHMWLRQRCLHPLACFLAAVSVMFGGAYFLRVLAGALSVLDTLAWTPLLLLCIDRLAERVSAKWTLVAIFAVSMMILAGHPPTAFMAGIAVALYTLPILWTNPERARLLACTASIAVAPMFLTAVQLWTGLDAASEATRQGGMSFEFATSYSFAPESLATLIVPGFLGDQPGDYVGRWFYWDASAYVGLVVFVFAAHAAFYVRGRMTNVLLLLVAALLVLSLGRYTPIYRLLYEVTPVFSYLRAPSKFMFFMTLFVAALGAVGLDSALRDRRSLERSAWVAGALALLLSVCWLYALVSPRVEWLSSPRQLIEGLDDRWRGDVDQWQKALPSQLLATTGIAALTTVCLLIARARGSALRALVIVGLLELVVFARNHHGTIELEKIEFQHPVVRWVYETAGTNRVFESGFTSNMALGVRGYGLWGYNAFALLRYREFVAFTQNRDAHSLDNMSQNHLEVFHPLFSMLRGEYQLDQSKVWQRPDVLPRFLLVREHRVVEGRDDIFAAIGDSRFDPRRTVILEQQPRPSPARGPSGGSITLLEESTDMISLEVDLPSAAILVVTDSYARGWRASALSGSSQSEYAVLPANYVLRAVPLAAGHHRIRLAYEPLSYRLGLWVSGVSGTLFVAVAVYVIRRRARS